jgi:hypothetical protein
MIICSSLTVFSIGMLMVGMVVLYMGMSTGNDSFVLVVVALFVVVGETVVSIPHNSGGLTSRVRGIAPVMDLCCTGWAQR